ncbi:HlyD family efflux transporter periplasmic adaptor subunit [Sorangium sp. So ce861]|uniref:HlyD family efflux transporter periplasmic adaptor subunit n=1 Tax=Sorangium sp. So ce861 TaxID=3133323 RepID=UPI003F628912
MLWPFRNQQLAITGAALAVPLAGALALAGLRAPDVAVLEPHLGAFRAAALPSAPAIDASPPDRSEPPRPAHPGFVGVLLSRRSVDLAARSEGRLRAVHVRLGDRVASGALLATRLLVRFAVPEERRAEVDENASVRVRAGGVELRATVETIAPEIDAVSRAIVVEARIEPGDAPRELLVAGEMARVFPAEGAP